jgi:hypothetical protein
MASAPPPPLTSPQLAVLPAFWPWLSWVPLSLSPMAT